MNLLRTIFFVKYVSFPNNFLTDEKDLKQHAVLQTDTENAIDKTHEHCFSHYTFWPSTAIC